MYHPFVFTQLGSRKLAIPKIFWWEAHKLILHHFPNAHFSLLHSSSLSLAAWAVSITINSTACFCFIETALTSNCSLVILLHTAQLSICFYSWILFGVIWVGWNASQLFPIKINGKLFLFNGFSLSDSIFRNKLKLFSEGYEYLTYPSGFFFSPFNLAG